MAQSLVDLDRTESLDAEGVLAWALERYHPRLAISVAGGSEGLVVLDMALRLEVSVKLFTIDTLRLHPETLGFFDEIEGHYGVKIERIRPDLGQIDRMQAAFGADLMFDGANLRALCCQVRKVLPLNHALAGLDAWVTGIRRDQTASRAGIGRVEIDNEHGGIVKVNPLADWTGDMVGRYTRVHDVPVHPLFAQGYASVGCEPCTRPTSEGEDERAGRWWWEADDVAKECGLHSRPVGALDFEMEEIVGEEGG